MTNKPARCPNPECGNSNAYLKTIKLPSDWAPPIYTVLCPGCGMSAGEHGAPGNALAAWAKMGAWRNGGWRDIETAPMDGSEIIAACYGDKTSGSYYWESEPNHWGETGWQEEDARGGPKLWRHPSKLDVWLPLPEPPKEEP